MIVLKNICIKIFQKLTIFWKPFNFMEIYVKTNR